MCYGDYVEQLMEGLFIQSWIDGSLIEQEL